MADSEDLALVRRERDRLLDSGWRTFRDMRKTWIEWKQRRATIDLPPHLRVEGINYQSPDLEFYSGQFVSERLIRPTKVDAIALSAEKKIVDDVDDCRIFYGCDWRWQNRNRRLDRARSRGQVDYGLSVERIFWEMPGTPEVEDKGSAEKTLRAMGNKVMESDEHSFRVESVHPMTFMCDRTQDPTLCIEESEINLFEARLKLKNGIAGSPDAGSRLDMDEKTLNLYWFKGDKQPLPQWNNQQAFTGKKLHLITVAKADPDGDDWTIAEYICPAGAGDSVDYNGGLKLSEEVVPGGRCPYILIPSGEFDGIETNPHLAFRPRMYPLYCDFAVFNFFMTVISSLGFIHSTRFYMNISKVDPNVFSMLEGMGVASEGEGAGKRLVFELPDPGKNEIMMSPTIEPMPSEVDQAILEAFREVKESIKNHQPNRFQTGGISAGQAAEMKATVSANTTEASSMPAVSDLMMQDAATVAIFEFERAAILFWPDTKEYPFLTTGDEPLMSGSRDPGSSGSVDAKKMAHRHQIYAVTRNETMAEEQIKALQAASDEQQLLITHRQHLAARGVDDVKKQEELLEADQQAKDDAPHVRQLLQQTRLAMFMALTGANQAALMGLPAPLPSGLPQTNPFPGPVEQTPDRSGAGPPKWKPAQYAEAPPPPPPPQLQPPGMGIAPSPTGFTAGSSPTGDTGAGR